MKTKKFNFFGLTIVTTANASIFSFIVSMSTDQLTFASCIYPVVGVGLILYLAGIWLYEKQKSWHTIFLYYLSFLVIASVIEEGKGAMSSEMTILFYIFSLLLAFALMKTFKRDTAIHRYSKS